MAEAVASGQGEGRGAAVLSSLRREVASLGGMAALLARAERIKSARSAGDADVYRYETSGGEVVLLKSYLGRCWLMRVLFGRGCLRREQSFLQLFRRLGVGRVPEVYGMLGADVLAMEFLVGTRSLPKPQGGLASALPPRSFFEELIAMMRELHERGLAHGDFRRGNVLMDESGRPRLIDVATACHCPAGSSWMRRTAFRMLCCSDDFSLARVVGSYYPALLDEEQSRHLRNVPWYLRLGRFLRHEVYRRLRGHRQHRH